MSQKLAFTKHIDIYDFVFNNREYICSTLLERIIVDTIPNFKENDIFQIIHNGISLRVLTRSSSDLYTQGHLFIQSSDCIFLYNQSSSIVKDIILNPFKCFITLL